MKTEKLKEVLNCLLTADEYEIKTIKMFSTLFCNKEEEILIEKNSLFGKAFISFGVLDKLFANDKEEDSKSGRKRWDFVFYDETLSAEEKIDRLIKIYSEIPEAPIKPLISLLLTASETEEIINVMIQSLYTEKPNEGGEPIENGSYFGKSFISWKILNAICTVPEDTEADSEEETVWGKIFYNGDISAEQKVEQLAEVYQKANQ